MTTETSAQPPGNPSGSTVRVGIIGGGPRGLSALERLLAHAAARPQTPLHVSVLEPFELGSGRVWRRDQSSQYMMNTPSLFPTVMPSAGTLEQLAEDDASVPAPIIAPLSFEDVRQRAVSSVHGRPGALLRRPEHFTAEELDALAGLSSTDYPQRKVYGAYLEYVAELLLEALPAHVTVEHVRQEAVGLHPRSDSGWAIETAPGAEGEGSAQILVDDVVLALGHVDAELNPAQTRFVQTGFAPTGSSRADGPAPSQRYFPPSIPADVDWAQIPAGASVVIRGMGLNFFDVVTELTCGRGGRFEAADGADGGRLRYIASGAEPKVIALSRRGLPYAAKPDFALPGFAFPDEDAAAHEALAGTAPESAFRVRFERFSEQRLEALMDEGPVDFMEKVWPLIHADAQAEYARAEGEGVFDLEATAKPLVGRQFASVQEHAGAVRTALESDAAAALDADASPSKRAVAVVHAARWVLKGYVARGLLTDDSRHRDLRGWFEPLIEGLASGPPSLRIVQLLALIEAGVVSIAGPNPNVVAGEEGFSVSSPWVTGSGDCAEYLIEAMMPANKVRILTSPLVRSLFETGVVREHELFLEGANRSGTGFDVTGPEHRIVARNGRAWDHLYCLGLQLSSAQWGTAIAAERDGAWKGGALSLADADACAAHILG